MQRVALVNLLFIPREILWVFITARELPLKLSPLLTFVRATFPFILSYRWLYINYIIDWLRSAAKATMKTKTKLAARKSKFERELEKIAAQYGVSSSSSELQV